MISLVGLSASPACRLIGLVGLIGLSNQWLHNCLNAAINVAAVTISTVLSTQGVATTQSSPTKLLTRPHFMISAPNCFTCIYLWGRTWCGGGLLLKRKVMMVDCLFWQILPRWCVTICKTIIFSQDEKQASCARGIFVNFCTLLAFDS